MIYPKVHDQEIPVHAAKSRMLETQKRETFNDYLLAGE